MHLNIVRALGVSLPNGSYNRICGPLTKKSARPIPLGRVVHSAADSAQTYPKRWGDHGYQSSRKKAN